MEILINRIRVRAFHGVFAQERKVGQEFEVSLRLEVSGYDGSDDLDKTVNYAEVIETVKEQMKEPSALIEHVGTRISKAVRAKFPQVTGGEVRITKLRPPVSAELESVEVCLGI